MLEMLTEVVGTEELLDLIALAELVVDSQMLYSVWPVRWICEFLATITTNVCIIAIVRTMESCLVASKSSA